MSELKNLSKCCNAPVKIGGEGLTHWYYCSACMKPLDICDIKTTGAHDMSNSKERN